MFLHVTSVRHLREFVLRVELSDGSAVIVDLADELDGEVFEPLRDPDLFGKVRVNPETGTIEWPNGADLAPEFLRKIGTDAEGVA
jgi:hypothetical protein